jgi:hypothetical protein
MEDKMSDPTDVAAHADGPDDTKSKPCTKSPLEQLIERHGENCKHIWHIIRVALVVLGVVWLTWKDYIFPNWDWAVPSLLILFGVAAVVIHRRWYPLFFVKGAVMTFAGLVLASSFFVLHYGAHLALLPKGSPLPLDQFARLVLWMVLWGECLNLTVYAVLERAKVHWLAMSFGFTLLTALVPQYTAMLWVLLARLQKAEQAAGLTSNPPPCSQEYITKLATDVATEMPQSDLFIPTVFEGYGWWDRKMKKPKSLAG